ncbi:nuclease-related domain-containing protein [Sporosarcina sp. Te-1]|uniref:nuclease-related domain-containing protein n=1 Tax=Sporosarcina sp. Te-1 TaxID=2818390 RepID=UPI001A9ECC09|nr:nuclease-related domain-containing protein [Sporosarcina sp. Te-1]QTD43486.1 NERD domain-containing protein [Sporosarcina sp. Te-1]
MQAGFGGEQELDKIFERYSFSVNYRVFHDLSLISSTPFQLDTLYITPWYALIFEVKNMSGELLVTDNPPQLIQTSESGQVSRFQSPITQLENNCALFTEWLRQRDFTLPVYGAIVLA